MFVDIHGIKTDPFNNNLWNVARRPVEYIITALE
jgi:hypothetical protein